ncbi:hypothetical protein HNO52_05530 [Billgrantia diversa]|uniref:hypothetical protein n=1 Tax=Halomonas sp. MCCC 1A13316 TaxID=2733487 RepID=UPI0018A3498E|nr:hypothetical protein [Halomonas sp. MCCC 1A13316]QOR38028.1 hypothetical protein HNO52_05530 [Halomonas sp. MCCC 1A13316]
MTQHERTVMAFDDQGREYMIDMFANPRELSEMQHEGAVRGTPTFRTHDGHDVSYLGNGEFMVMVPGEEGGVTVRTDDSEFV